MNDFKKEEIEQQVKTYNKATVAYMNKLFDGICEFKLIETDDLISDISKEKIDE